MATAATRDSQPATAAGIAPSTVGDALHMGRGALFPSRTASLDSQLLLASLLGRDRAWVIAHHEATVSSEIAARFGDVIRRRRRGEPVAYLLGRAFWYDLELEVTPAVLVPRPETELLLERACALANQLGADAVADVGTGSGALAIGLARGLPSARIEAVDISEAAIAVAAANVRRYGLEGRVRLHVGDLVDPLAECPDLVVANLPYLSASMMDELDDDVCHEPSLALYGGPAGLEQYVRLARMLRRRGWQLPMVIEIDPRQSMLLAKTLPEYDLSLEPDYAGRERVVTLWPRGS